MKEKFMDGCKGAISIFLVIVLVPMMTISCLFVDMSRYRLSKAVIESAGDLAFNSALTQYDSLLQEYYGLFATSQSIDEVLENMDDYFIECIVSAGISEEYAQQLSSGIMGSILDYSDEDLTDILNIMIDETSFSMVRTEGGSICNPVLMKSQIVNFMKYRAPINTGLALLNSLKSFANISKEAELVENRTDYYKEEEKVNSYCQTAWNNINSYNSLECCTDTSYFKTLKNNFSTNNGGSDDNAYFKCYKAIIEKAYSDIYVSNNENTDKYLNFAVPINKESQYYMSTYKSERTRTPSSFTWYFVGDESCYGKSGGSYYLMTKYKGKSYSVKKNGDSCNVNTATEIDLQAAIRSAYDAYLKISSTKNNINLDLNYDSNSENKIRYVCRAIKNSKEYIEAGQDFINAMQVLEHRYWWVADASIKNNYTTIDGNTAKNNTLSFSTDDLGKKTYNYKGKTWSYDQWYNRLSDYMTDNNSWFGENFSFQVKLGVLVKEAKNQYDISLDSINKELKKISTEITNYKTILTSAKKYLENASSALDSIYKEVVNADSELNKAKDKWQQNANDLDDSSSIASQDKAEIANVAKHFKPEDIDKLKKRIDNIIVGITDILDKLDDYKFGKKSLMDIKDYNKDLRNILHGVATNNSDGKVYSPVGTTKNDSLSRAAERVYELGYVAGNMSLDWVNQQDSNPYLKQHILNFYIYLYKNFNKTGDYSQIASSDNNELKTKDEDTAGKSDSGEDTIAAEGDAGVNDVKNSDKEDKDKESKNISKQENLPSDSPIENIDGSTSKNKTQSATSEKLDNNKDTAVSSAQSSSSNLFKNIGSYVKNASTELRDNIYMTEYVMDMFSYDTIELTGNSNSKLAEGKIQSLTCNPINPTNNLAYGSEIEYILYGGTNSANVASAYATIYGVRMCFNLIYAFTDAELRSITLGIATPISAATMGVVPIPLIQAGLLTACALAESGLDIASLKAGKRIPVYKNTTTWRTSPSGLGSAVLDTAKPLVKDVTENIIDSGVNKLTEVLDYSSDELKNLADSGAEEITNAVSAAYNQVVEEQIDAVVNQINALVVSFVQNSNNEKGEFSVQGSREYVVSELEKWIANDTSTGLIKEVRVAAVNYIISNPAILDSLLTSIQNSSSESSLTIANKIEAASSSIKEAVNSTVRETLDVDKYITDANNQIKESLNSGADELKDTLNTQIDKLCGTNTATGGTGATSGTASILSFNYRDYLRLFVLLKFMTNEQTALVRMSDVIQVNMARVSGDAGYLLKNSSCYLTISCSCEVKPMFLAAPILSDWSQIDEREGLVYTIDYNKTRGY